MADEAEVKRAVIEWLQKKSGGEKHKYYLKDIVHGLADRYPKREVQMAVNACTEEGSVKYFSTGSTTMFTLPEFFKE